jgi:signal transduction histidine kinase
MKTASRLILGTISLLLIALLLTTWLMMRELTGEPLLADVSKVASSDELRWHLAVILLRVGAPLFAATLALYLWARHLMAPMTSLANAARRLNAEQLHARLPLSGRGDEFDELTVIFNDMTARLERSFERVRDFTLNASHELKTPLTIMRADVEEMLDAPGMDESQRDRLSDHLDEIDRLARLVDALSFLTKADAHLVHLASEPIALDELVREAADDTEVLSAACNITAALGKCDPARVKGDRHRLRQVLLILCDNAVKYNLRDGTGRVRLELRADDSHARITVANTCPPLSAEEQAHVFDRFYRGAAEQSRAIEGSGLGLCIAQWLVQQHGGSIACESGAEETWFIITLPVVTD